MKVDDEQIRQRILERTAQLIENRGLKGWNMDRLAEEVGLAKNTLYKIIGSKEALVEKVIIGYIRGVQSRIVEVIRRGDDYIKTLEKLTAEFPELLNSIQADSMQEIFLEYPSIQKAVREHQDELTNSILEFIRAGIKQGVLRSDVKPYFIFELLRAQVMYHIGSGAKGQELSERISLSFQCLFYGLMR